VSSKTTGEAANNWDNKSKEQERRGAEGRIGLMLPVDVRRQRASSKRSACKLDSERRPCGGLDRRCVEERIGMITPPDDHPQRASSNNLDYKHQSERSPHGGLVPKVPRRKSMGRQVRTRTPSRHTFSRYALGSETEFEEPWRMRWRRNNR